MHVQMLHFLMGVFTVVHEQPVATLQHPFGPGHLTGSARQAHHRIGVFRAQLPIGDNMLFRHDQHMDGRAGLDVAKGDDILILLPKPSLLPRDAPLSTLDDSTITRRRNIS